MIVVRFKVKARPEASEAVRAVLEQVVEPSRLLEGVINFDIGRDLTDPDCFIATEVFDDRAALDRQEAQAEVAKALEVLGVSLAAEPEATIYHVASSEPHRG